MQFAIPRAAMSRFLLVLVILLAACGGDDEAAEAPTSLLSASPTTTAAVTSPTDVPTTDVPTMVAPTHSVTASAVEPTPTVPFVDTTPLDDPALGVTVYWLGLRFAPAGALPALVLSLVAGPGGPADIRGHLDYTASDTLTASTSVTVQFMRRADWDEWAAQDPAGGDPFATIYHMFWDSPCAQREEIELENGQAVIYSSYQALADPATTECPSGSFDRYLTHVFVGDTVVLVNAPYYLEEPRPVGNPSPYNSSEGMRAVLHGLQPRAPVAEPTPLPTPAARLDDPGSLVLQAADLPGRYAYGDDGCAPGRECFTGPSRFSSEGGTDALITAAGEFVSFYYQYEHVGFSRTGTPDPTIEPPTIDSSVFICVRNCDPAAILEVGADLLDYEGHERAREIQTTLHLGDEARLYEVDTLVAGQVATGYAVLWRHGPVVGLVVIGGGAGERGQALAIELARKQEARIQAASA